MTPPDPRVRALLESLPKYEVSDVDDMLLPKPTANGCWVHISDLEHALHELLAEARTASRPEKDPQMKEHEALTRRGTMGNATDSLTARIGKGR